jgi:hypothetical protein
MRGAQSLELAVSALMPLKKIVSGGQADVDRVAGPRASGELRGYAYAHRLMGEC